MGKASNHNEASLRAAFVTAIREKELPAARDVVRAMTVQRFGQSEGLEQRLWEVVSAYTALLTSSSDKMTLRRMIRTSLNKSGVVIALIDLQAWAKPRRLAITLTLRGLGDMTCEGVMVEMQSDFSPDMVGRSQRFLAEHRSALPPGG